MFGKDRSVAKKYNPYTDAHKQMFQEIVNSPPKNESTLNENVLSLLNGIHQIEISMHLLNQSVEKTAEHLEGIEDALRSIRDDYRAVNFIHD